jgi:hypothetical protein
VDMLLGSRWVLVGVLLLWSGAARAERELIVPFEEGGHVVLDQISGLRVGSTGIAYAGPVGLGVRTDSSGSLVPGGAPSETSTTTLWAAPSVDVFVIDHLSVGGRVEVAHTWGAIEGDGARVELPGTTSMAFLPRIGFYAPFGDRLGLWPRAAFGYSSASSAQFLSTGSGISRETFHALLLEVDLSLVYRFGETFFMKAGPDVSVTLGGRREVEVDGIRAGASKSVLSFSGVLGFGVNLEL